MNIHHYICYYIQVEDLDGLNAIHVTGTKGKVQISTSYMP